MSYFIEIYCKLLTPSGIKNIRLLNSQKKCLGYLKEKQYGKQSRKQNRKEN
jgi:hypothetical protein